MLSKAHGHYSPSRGHLVASIAHCYTSPCTTQYTTNQWPSTPWPDQTTARPDHGEPSPWLAQATISPAHGHVPLNPWQGDVPDQHMASPVLHSTLLAHGQLTSRPTHGQPRQWPQKRMDSPPHGADCPWPRLPTVRPCSIHDMVITAHRQATSWPAQPTAIPPYGQPSPCPG
jgi:hypothetical protein